MKVMFIPDARDKNSYQTNLSSSLAKQDVHVYFDNGSVIKSILKHRPDILHIHWPYPFLIANSKITTITKSICFICGLLVLKLFGMKIIWTVHNIVDHEGRFRSEELLFSKFLARVCNRLIVHCYSAKIDVEKIYGKNSSSVIVIPHGNYIGQYKNTITYSQSRSKLMFRPEDTVFLYFGQIRSYKGVPELINTFKRLICQDVRLLIVGKPLNDEIVTDILKNCKDDYRIKYVLEFIPDEDIQIYMNAADIVVLPYKNVLTSGATILAISFSKPIIAPAYKCIMDTLDEKGSFLYSKEDNSKDGLFGAMQRALRKNKETLLNMGKHNFQLAEQFQWDEIAKKTYDIYQKCIKIPKNKKKSKTKGGK